MAKQKKSGTGLDKNTTAALAYILGWVSGLALLLIEKKDKFVRFHAMQSVITFGALNLAVLVPIIGWMLSPIVMLVSLVLWLVCLIKAYQGEEFMVPVAGQLAKKQLEKTK